MLILQKTYAQPKSSEAPKCVGILPHYAARYEVLLLFKQFILGKRTKLLFLKFLRLPTTSVSLPVAVSGTTVLSVKIWRRCCQSQKSFMGAEKGAHYSGEPDDSVPPYGTDTIREWIKASSPSTFYSRLGGEFYQSISSFGSVPRVFSWPRQLNSIHCGILPGINRTHLEPNVLRPSIQRQTNLFRLCWHLTD